MWNTNSSRTLAVLTSSLLVVIAVTLFLQSLNSAQLLELLRFLPPGALICAGVYGIVEHNRKHQGPVA
jgi:hypothetical protein